MPAITTIAELEEIYGQPTKAATIKVLNQLSPSYKRFILASPFIAMASVGPKGLDCSPRGDQQNVVRIADEKTLLMPDWRGNNRIDTLRNIVSDPRIALMFLVPGSNTVLRINGRAIVTADKDICAQFEVDAKHPRTVIAIDIGEVYFQCARAVKRARLWDPTTHIDSKNLPTPGDMLTEASNGDFDGKSYDKNWSERAAKTMW